MKYIYILILSLSFALHIEAQQIEIDFKNKPLSMAIVEIRDNYGLYFSFNEQLLSVYNITIAGRFIDAGSFLDEALEGLPFSYKQSGPVWIIVPTDAVPSIKYFTIEGQVLDKVTRESLPYSHVFVNGSPIVTDAFGAFLHTSKSDSVFNLKVSYLGYYIYDTLVLAGSGITIGLLPSLVGLKEVVVEGKEIDFSSQIGERPGEVKLNHQVAKFLPGYGDNSVFNLLRLQPGVMASGEKSDYLTIWGSYDGQNEIIFDGYTLFGLNNFNDQISSVNPFMVKYMQLYKGGFGAQYGEKVGGIVNIHGIEGNPTKPTFNLLVNNLTINGLASIPVGERAAFVLAYRRTFYNLYNNLDIDIPEPKNRKRQEVDFNLLPDYNFQDMNLKFSGKARNGDNYFVSAYKGGDQFEYQLESDLVLNKVERSSQETNDQYGVSAFYNLKGKKCQNTNLLLSYASLDVGLESDDRVSRIRNGRVRRESQQSVNNNVQTFSAKLENDVTLNKNNHFYWGGGTRYSYVALLEDSGDIEQVNLVQNQNNYFLFARHQVWITERLQMEAGIRANYPDMVNKMFIQPRLLLKTVLSDKWDVNAAWGLYNQFLAKSMVIDQLGNRHFIWTISNGDGINVLQSEHSVINVNFENKGFEFNLEGYYKTTEGIARYLLTNDFGRLKIDMDAKSYGLDFYIKKDYRKHSAWLSYSLGKCTELFQLRDTVREVRALQDQRHEVKFAGLVNMNPVYFSASYVYGSGFRDPSTSAIVEEQENIPYNRCDVSVYYRFRRLNFKLETGLSIMNLFNTSNIKFDNLYRVPNDVGTIDINIEAVPFTPTIFLNVSF